MITFIDTQQQQGRSFSIISEAYLSVALFYNFVTGVTPHSYVFSPVLLHQLWNLCVKMQKFMPVPIDKSTYVTSLQKRITTDLLPVNKMNFRKKQHLNSHYFIKYKQLLTFYHSMIYLMECNCLVIWYKWITKEASKFEEVNYIDARTTGSQELAFIHDWDRTAYSENRSSGS